MLVQNLLSPLFPELIFRIRTSEKKIFLTFDDGPTPEITPWVLEELRGYNAHATFFCIGNNVEKYPALISQIIKAGHSVGNHTENHFSGWKLKTQNYLNDVEMCDASLRAFSQESGIRNQEPKLFRPPYGKITPSQYSYLKKNYRIVMWDVLSKDYDLTFSPEKCLQRVITKSKPGSIIVFHDSAKAEKNLRYALPKAMEYFSEMKFSFNSLTN